MSEPWANMRRIEGPSIYQTQPDPRDVTIAALRAEVERLREALEETTELLAGWCKAIDDKGTSWDDWDEYYKEACYEPNQYSPNRGVIARARAALAEKEPT